MAHILVYLQRTPAGLHPASAVGLCMARDIATTRGATVSALCAGDAGVYDRRMARAAGAFGADVLTFCGPRGLENLHERLAPVHIFAPWSPEGIAAVQGLDSGPAIPRWIRSSNHQDQEADAVTGIIAGTVPWHRFHEELEAEYEGDVDEVPLPPWIETDAAATGPAFGVVEGEPLGYVCPDGTDPAIEIALQRWGARRMSPSEVAGAEHGTHVWLGPGAGPLPDTLSHRSPTSRLLLLPGPDGQLDPSWSSADLVLGGSWPEVIEQLRNGQWQMNVN